MTTTGNNLPNDRTTEANVHNPADWVPDTKPIPPELDDEYEAATYPPKPVHFDTIEDKLDHATLAQLRELMNGGIGEPDAHT